MELKVTPEQAQFAAEVRRCIAPYAGLDKYLLSNDEPELRAFYRTLAERNWLALAWPADQGGLGSGPIDEFLLWNEIGYRRIARMPLSVGVVAKTILRYGTPAQKKRWLEPIRRYDINFALAYSEPEAGSDLTGLRCRAERRDGRYILNGNKCWNSKAHKTDYLWLLCRTGEPASRAAGLSLIIVDRKTPGVTIRPIEKMDGNLFTEIFFDAAEVPEENRIGPENGAWAMMNAALADERHVQFLYGRVVGEYEQLADWVRAHDLQDDPLVRARMAELHLEVLGAQVQCLRVIEAVLTGRAAAADAAANKLVHVRTLQNIARAAMTFGVAEALLVEDALELNWRQTMTESIGGGTTEVMTGIVARQRLGLGVSK